jgi:hypothetical protein
MANCIPHSMSCLPFHGQLSTLKAIPLDAHVSPLLRERFHFPAETQTLSGAAISTFDTSVVTFTR